MSVHVDNLLPCSCVASCQQSNCRVQAGSHPDRRSASSSGAPLGRRALVNVALAAGLVAPLAAPIGRTAFAQDKRMARPDKGDLLVYASGDKAREVITLADLPVGGRPVMAWPMEPASKTLRDGSRLNQIVLVRLDAESLDEATRAHAVDGVVAYSATCTHALCPVTG